MRSDNLQLVVYNFQLPHITSNFLMVAMIIMVATVMVVIVLVVNMVVSTGQDKTDILTGLSR